jgi:hypothetical protein
MSWILMSKYNPYKPGGDNGLACERKALQIHNLHRPIVVIKGTKNLLHRLYTPILTLHPITICCAGKLFTWSYVVDYHDDWLLVRLQLKCGSKLSKLHWHVEIITAEMVSVRENSSKQTSRKEYLLRSFFEMFGYKTFVKIYLILPEILGVINWRESGFSRILKSKGGYWVPETLVEQSKTRNEHGSGTHIEISPE